MYKFIYIVYDTVWDVQIDSATICATRLVQTGCTKIKIALNVSGRPWEIPMSNSRLKIAYDNNIVFNYFLSQIALIYYKKKIFKEWMKINPYIAILMLCTKDQPITEIIRFNTILFFFKSYKAGFINNYTLVYFIIDILINFA